MRTPLTEPRQPMLRLFTYCVRFWAFQNRWGGKSSNRQPKRTSERHKQWETIPIPPAEQIDCCGRKPVGVILRAPTGSFFSQTPCFLYLEQSRPSRFELRL